MNENRKKIGVLDSGVGGLTVVKELEALLPNEDIIYFGDNKNCPYGNRTEENIVEIAHGSIGFLKSHGVKAVVIACNTTSSLIHRFEADYQFPIFSIIRPVAEYVVERRLPSVGVIATELTIRSGSYGRLIHEGDPNIVVCGEPSHSLAALVDCGEFNMPVIAAEVHAHIKNLLTQRPLRHIIYGCTHYPIVGEVFEQFAPEVEFINPAREQAKAAARYLAGHSLLNDAPEHSFDIFTSGSAAVYEAILHRLEIERPAVIHGV